MGEKAQSKVPKPKGLDLDNWIVEPSSWELVDGDLMTFDADEGLESSDDEDQDGMDRFKKKLEKGKGKARDEVDESQVSLCRC